MCKAGNFRWNLYYRLAVVELTLPSLRQRSENERRELITFFIEKVRKEFRKPGIRLSRSVQDLLFSYPFPGNIRELENLITNLAVFTENEVRLIDLPARIRKPIVQDSDSLNWQEVEKKLLIRALKEHKGNQRRAWQAVGYKSLNTFRKKLKEYGIDPC